MDLNLEGSDYPAQFADRYNEQPVSNDGGFGGSVNTRLQS